VQAAVYVDNPNCPTEDQQTVSTVVRDIISRHELLGILVSRNLKIRYKSSTLGFLWSLLVPIFLIVIYKTFLTFMKFDIELEVLVTGVIVWQFFTMCVGDSLHAIVGNANLVTKASFPRLILPASMVLANLVNFLLSCVVLVVFLLIMRADFGPLYWLPLIVLSQTALCLGVSLFFSASNVFFRDTEHLQSMILLAWFFMTPVIYPMSLVMDGLSSWVSWIFFLNPMTGIVTAYRILFLSAENPGAWFMGLSFGVAWLLCAAGIAVFQRVEGHFSDEL
jgi:lipopolysaccharide transport system permease protein